MSDQPQASGDEWPSATVVIPAYEEEARIGACLEGIRGLDYPADRVRVVVVDNGSRDRTAEVARQAGVEVVQLPAGLVGAVRNHGVALGPPAEILAFIDADCVPTRTWLRRGVDVLLHDDSVGAVGGTCRAPERGTWLERAWEPAEPPEGEVRSLAASSLIMRRQLFTEVGGFNERLSAGEDDELSQRLRAGGRRLVASPGCAVYHLGWPQSLREVFRRQRWQGSSMLTTASGATDVNLLLAHFVVLAPLLVAGLAWWLGVSSWVTWLPVALVLAIPGLAAVRRSLRRNDRRGWKTRAVRLYAIFSAYYLGRAAGLLTSYRRVLFGVPRHVEKTWERDARSSPDRGS